eukprot:528814-Rhodomonas_salina.1
MTVTYPSQRDSLKPLQPLRRGVLVLLALCQRLPHVRFQNALRRLHPVVGLRSQVCAVRLQTHRSMSRSA